MFDQGKSENPQIGTVEDWFLINVDNFVVHPFHFHLINYQIVRDYYLKTYKTPNDHECAYYEIDFFMKYANKTQCFTKEIKQLLDGERNQDFYDQMCDFVVDNSTMNRHRVNLCFGKLKN